MRPIASLPRKQKRQNSLQSKAFPLVEMGELEPPTPYMRGTLLETESAYETQEIANFLCYGSFSEVDISSGSVRDFR
jgi:hypothetical protein